MKTGIKFTIQAVVAGQKSSTINAEPQLIANSTAGKFMVTSPVSKALGVAPGENIMFLNNIDAVEQAIQQRVPDVVAYANENGIDIDSAEGQATLLATFSQWFIAKGVLKYDSKGEAIMASARFTKEDKEKFLKEHGVEIAAANHNALVERNGGVDATDEELAQLLTVDDVESPKYHDAEGSRTATTGSATGVGCPLNFTDTAIWNKLKADLGDNKTKKNRIYSVLLEEPETVPYKMGNSTVDVTAYPIEFVEDVDPIVRGEKGE